MLLSSELIVRPTYSKTYLRFILVMHALSIAFVCYSSFAVGIKIIIFYFIFKQLTYDAQHQRPCPDAVELSYRNTKWYLLNKEGHITIYENACALIHNPLFQLLQLNSEHKRRFLILFNDQLPDSQLRTLMVKTSKNSI